MVKNVIYIGGYGRSGSTILALLLGQLAQVFSAGELGVIWAALHDKRNCTCGEKLRECPFWADLINEKYNLLIKSHCPPNVALEHIYDKTDTNIVIDSTKTSWRNALRPWALNASGYKVHYIHMHRSLKGVLSSAKKGKNTDLEDNIQSRSRLTTIKTVSSRLIANIISYCYLLYFYENSTQISFENLQKNPAKTIENFDFLTVEQKRVLVEIVEKKIKLNTRHEINGNRLLRKKDIRFLRN